MRGAFPCYHGANNNANDRQEYEAHYRIDDLRRRRLAHADNGKAVFVQGAVAGDIVEAEVVQDGKSFMRARTTETLEPSPDRIQPPLPLRGHLRRLLVGQSLTHGTARRQGAKPALHARAHRQVRP